MPKKKLTPKQDLFCNEYLTDFNVTQAAIRAGYSKKTAYSIGWELLRNPEISEEIAKIKEKRIARVAFDADDFFNTLIKYVKSDINDFFDLSKDGILTLKDLDKIDGTLVSEIRENIYGITIKLQDKAKALEMIARHLNLFKEDQEAGADKIQNLIAKLDEEAEELVTKSQNSNNTDADNVPAN